MSLKYMYITNRPEVAKIAETAGVDWIFVDLEVWGKAARQGGMNTVQSHHTVEDVMALRKVLARAELLVRVDPIHEGSAEQIESVIAAGADLLMLPMWRTPGEVSRFLELVGGRCRTVLLLETREAEECLDEMLSLPGVDMVHIGLNDLSLSYHRRFLFEPLADGTVERICRRLGRAGVSYGFGGVGRVGGGMLPAEHILGEHVRLGSDRVILSRSFCGGADLEDLDRAAALFRDGVRDLRDFEARFRSAPAGVLEENHRRLCREVAGIAERLGRSGKEG